MMFVNIIRNTYAIIRKLQTNKIPHLQKDRYLARFFIWSYRILTSVILFGTSTRYMLLAYILLMMNAFLVAV